MILEDTIPSLLLADSEWLADGWGGGEFRGPGGAEQWLARKLPPAGGLSGKNSIDQEANVPKLYGRTILCL